VGLKWGPISFVSTIEELLERKAPVQKTEITAIGMHLGETNVHTWCGQRNMPGIVSVKLFLNIMADPLHTCCSADGALK
jgi:hypothetical protein